MQCWKPSYARSWQKKYAKKGADGKWYKNTDEKAPAPLKQPQRKTETPPAKSQPAIAQEPKEKITEAQFEKIPDTEILRKEKDATEEAETTEQNGNPTMQGKIVDIKTKSGTSKGKPWTLYMIFVYDGQKDYTLNTFSETLNMQAVEFLGSGAIAVIEYTETPKGLELISIEECVLQ